MRNVIYTAALIAALAAAPDPAAVKIQGPDTLGTLLPIQSIPPGASVGTQTQVSVTAQGTTGVVTATMPAVAGQTNYVTGFEVSGSGATAATAVSVTLSNVKGTPIVYILGVPAGAGSAATNIAIEFTYPLQGTAVNTAVTLSQSGFGAGATNVNVTLHGFTQ